MTLTDSELTFNGTPASIVFSVAVVFATAVFSFLIWKRNQYALPTGLLEALRILILIAVALTLNQPEWKETFEPDEKPVIGVLRDDSGSMTTADVIEESGTGAAPPSRAAVATRLTRESDWEPLAADNNLVFLPFDGGESEGTDLSGALSSLIEEQPSLRGVVLISDGDWNTGDPPARIATRYRMQDIPVFTVPIGSETRLPDLEVTAFDAPTFGIAGKPVRLPFSLSSALPRNHSATVEIETSEGEILTSNVTIPAMGKTREIILWTPLSEGDYELTLTLPPAEGERDLDNNVLTAPISIRKEELKVLVIDSFPRWEYRYLRNALERDPGVEVSCLLLHPDVEALGGGPGYLDAFPEPDLLSTFDVIILGDVGFKAGQLDEAQVLALKNQVSTQAAGLVLLPGFRGNQGTLAETVLDDLFPVVLDPAQPRGWGSPTPGQFELTELGARSLLTRLEDTENANAEVWASLPGFQWYAGVMRARAGSEVLATHSSETNQYGRIPLIVTRTFGTGKILFMGTDGAWRWRKGVEDKYHYRFWGQVARWMAYQRNMASDELMRLFYSPDRPQTGDTLTLNANVMSVGGEPLQSANVVVQVVAPSGKVDSIRLEPGGEDQWGLFTGNFEPVERGEHALTVTCEENGGALNLAINVQGTALEKIGEPARLDVMEEIARISKGEMLSTFDIAVIQSRLSALPNPEPIEQRLRIWSNPWWIGSIVFLMTIFWIGRKVVGAV